LRGQALKSPFLSSLRAAPGLLPHLLGVVLLWSLTLGLLAGPALAAEIRSVRSATLLQIGDQNRTYSIQLACLSVPESNQQEALAWLQKHGPRGTKVNLRPISEQDGRLVAQLRVLRTGQDLGEAMVAEGLATPTACGDIQPAS
jgi:endonuclease YncB( thermonuclease family)